MVDASEATIIMQGIHNDQQPIRLITGMELPSPNSFNPKANDVGRKLTWQNREKLLALRDVCGPVARRPAPEATQLGPVTLRNIEVRGLQRMSSDRVLDRLHIQEETKPKLELGASVITDDGVAVLARLRQENIFGRAGLGLLSYRYSDRNANLQGLLDQANGSGWLGLRIRLLWQRERPGVYENGVEVDKLAVRRTQVGLDLVIRDFRRGWSLYLGGDMAQGNRGVRV